MNIEKSTSSIKQRILNYLDLSLPVKKAMPNEIAQKFNRFQNGEEEYAGQGLDFIKEPYIELATVYKESDESLKQLVESGDLECEVAKAFAKYLLDDAKASPEDVKLYTHQLNSLRSVNRGRNLVVCTGTGSGKTECFLLPVVNAIYKQHKESCKNGGEYKKHIRALILYPMNALVNDQVRRLRKLLKYLPDITFGCFTSETKRKLRPLNSPDDFMNLWNHGVANNYMQGDGNGNQDEDNLNNEYRYRAQWSDGGADILVTNFAMLERLLLLPNQGFFETPWDFIVLDEAHSYSGAAGTEIAWLVRRLQNRLDHEGVHNIRYLATSATLSTASDIETREQKTKEFASGIFPASADTFDVYNGEIEKFVSHADINSEDVNIFNDEVKDLRKDTVALEARKTKHKLSQNRIKLFREILKQDGKVKISSLGELDIGLFERHPKVFDTRNNQALNGNEIVVTDEIQWLCKLMLTYSRNNQSYRNVLHDEMDGSKSEDNGGDLRLGNRLSLLDIWKNLAADNLLHPTTIHWETVFYLYRALEILLQPEVRIEDAEGLQEPSIQNIRVILAAPIRTQIEAKINAYCAESEAIKEEEAKIFERWQNSLKNSQGENYREWIYNALVLRNDISRFFSEILSPKPISVVATSMGINVARLGQLMALGALAYPLRKRRPLVDVRFHQVVRDISNVGVYFQNGNLNAPVFVNSEDEYASTGEKIFGLGVCRRCGQPYLLGYGNERQGEGGNVGFEMNLSRFATGQYKHLHAFTLNPPEEDNIDEDTENQQHGICINLRTGKVSCNANLENNGVEAFWFIAHKIDEVSFLSKCNACGGTAIASAKYGIITPYEATGIQFKISTLEAFAGESDPDPDAEIQQSAPAEGRKILAFADSRSGAASLAFSFDNTIQARYCDELVQRLRASFRETIDEQAAVARAVQDFANKGINLEPMELIGNPILRKYMEPRVAEVQELVLNPNGGNEFKRLVVTDHYERLLSLERDNGDMVNGDMDGELVVSKLRVLKALVASNRRIGLLPLKRLVVKSKYFKGLTRDEPDFASLFCGPIQNISDDQLKDILQKIYSYLVCSKRIYFENDDLKNAFYRWEPSDNFTEATVAPKKISSNHAVTKIVRSCLVDFNVNNVSNEQMTILLKSIWTVIQKNPALRNSGNDRYVFNFSDLCKDLIVEPGDAFQQQIANEQKVLPLIIQEHTAQIDSHIGAVFQRAFSEGKINILSCSTTFEMGVDVGSLNSVFLGNMPPSTANYKQRAGRAGRRPGSAPWILTLCGSHSSYDRDRYENPEKLFFGEVEPPRLYLDRPQFAARHMRAEALHDFIQWIKDCKLNSANLAEKTAAKKWNKISYFLIGCNAVQGANGEGFICNTIDATCCGWLMDWKNDRANCVKEFVRGIYRYREDFINNLLGVNDYSPVDDIVWQLKGDNNFLKMNAEDGLAFFRSLGGCNIPEISNAAICPNSRHKWRSLEERLKWKLWLLADANDGMIQDDQMADNVAHNGGTLTLSQAKVLWGSTIDVLSDACVLPRYGFPVDTISLITDRDDGDAYGIELSRPIHLGMYEYAPRQSVYANKRRYESRGAKVYRFNNGDANLVANANGTVLKYCDSCHKVFYHGEEMCPCCQGQTKNQTFVTPELFIARRGSINPPREYSPRQRLVSWGGQVRQRSMCPVSEMSLTVAEPTERVVNYVNTNIRDKNWFYLCEVPTNVVLWIPGFLNSHQAFNGWVGNRIANAFTSAMYALRKSMSGVLNVNERDIGALIQAYHSGNDNSFWFVFFDADNGGGSGCVLDLLVRNVYDINGVRRVRKIVQSAIAILEGCSCGAQHDNAYADLTPVPISDYNPNNNTQRPVQSCYHCLRNYDNQFEHDKLDKYDAIKVLRLLLEDSSNVTNRASQEPIVVNHAVVAENMVEQDADFDEKANSWEIGGYLFRRITEEECNNLQNGSYCLFKIDQAPGYRIGYLRSDVDRNAILGVKR